MSDLILAFQSPASCVAIICFDDEEYDTREYSTADHSDTNVFLLSDASTAHRLQEKVSGFVRRMQAVCHAQVFVALSC